MSICDLCSHIMTLLYWSTVGFNYGNSWISSLPFEICWCMGLIFQFSLISSATWSFAIAINLFRLMKGAAPYDLASECETEYICCKKNHIIIWSLSIICSLIPITNYGLTQNPEQQHS